MIFYDSRNANGKVTLNAHIVVGEVELRGCTVPGRALTMSDMRFELTSTEHTDKNNERADRRQRTRTDYIAICR
jgi:hypothetical protein